MVDNQFTQGSKDFLLAADLAWAIVQTKAKNDIANGGFGLANQVKFVDSDNVAKTLDGSFLVFAGDRTSNNGDAQIGFWFYLNSTAPVEVNGNRYFAPAHTRGDLLVLADFTGGGRLGTVKVYRWIGGGVPTAATGSIPASTVVPNTNGNLETTNIASIVAENNAGTPDVPAGWSFLREQYETNEFFEGFVDLSSIGGTTNFTCSATVLLETRSSQSITASLDDFIGGTLGEVPMVTVNSPTICAGGSATLTATPSPPRTYTYAWSGPGGFTSTLQTITVNVVGDYYVTVTNTSGCPSSPGKGTLSNYPVTPDDTASGEVCVGNKFTYEGIEYAIGTHNIDRTDANGCPWKTVLTVTDYPVTPDDTASGEVCVGNKFTYEGIEYATGTHNIDRTDANGCPWKTVLTVSNYPVTEDDTAEGMVCVGFEYTYEGKQYGPGVYDIPRTDSNGCAWKTVLNVQENPIPLAPTGTDVTACFDNTAKTGSATVGSGETLIWCTASTGGTLITAPSRTAVGSSSAWAGVKITGTDCEGPRTLVTVTINPLPQITCPDPASTTVLCGVTIAVAQANTDTKFSSWLSGFTYDSTLYTVGITYVYDPITSTIKSDNGNGPKIPVSGGTAKVTATWTLTNKVTACKNSCSSTFTVDNECKIDCSSSKTDVLCEGTDTGTITISANGGSIPYTVYLYKEGSVSPDYTKANINTSPFSVTFENLVAGNYTYSVIDANYAITQEVCNEALPIKIGPGVPCGAHCTYTQGYYGNDRGKSCADGVLYSTKDLIAKALISYPLETMTIGVKANGIVGDFNEFGHSISMSNNAIDIAKIIQVLPGGGSSSALLQGDFTITTMPTSYLKKGNINNTLLAQTITLGLNLGIDGTLGSFALQAGKLATAAPQGGCGSKIPMLRSCSAEGYAPTINEYKYYTVPAVVGLLPTPTVQGLYDMANKALGREILPAGVTLSNLASAVDLINNAFDGCRISMGYDQVPLLCDTSDPEGFVAFSVPIVNNQLTIKYKFAYDSDVTIDVFDAAGNKVYSKTDTNSYLDKEVVLNHNFNTGTQKVYIVRVTTKLGHSERKVVSSPN